MKKSNVLLIVLCIVLIQTLIIVPTENIYGANGTSKYKVYILAGQSKITMLPLRFISENLGISVEWNNDYRTIYLDK